MTSNEYLISTLSDACECCVLQEYSLEVDLGQLQIAYKESIQESVTKKHVLDKTIGDQRHLVTMAVSVHPNPGGDLQKHIEVARESQLARTRIRRQHLQAINSGLRSGLSRGESSSHFFFLVQVQVYLLIIRLFSNDMQER